MSAFAFDKVCWSGPGRSAGHGGFARSAGLALGLALLFSFPAVALDGSQPSTIDKIPLKLFKNAQQALSRRN